MSSQHVVREQQLLPGIPDDITFHQIVPRLSWRVFHTVSSVSGACFMQLELARCTTRDLKSHSMEILVLVTDVGPGNLPAVKPREDGGGPPIVVPHRIALYSMRDNSYSLLPPIPNLRELKFPTHSQCVLVDGKIYLLRGEVEILGSKPSSKVYMLGLAGWQSQRKECASRKESRSRFGCGVVHGKISVFLGVILLANLFMGLRCMTRRQTSGLPLGQ